LVGGAWPFLVGGVICLLNCDNEPASSHMLVLKTKPCMSMFK